MLDIGLELVAWVHVFSAIIWFGSIITIFFIIIPSIKKSEISNKANLLIQMGKRVGIVVGIATGLVLLTGILRVWYVIGDNINLLLNSFWGNVLLLKVLLFLVFASTSGIMGKKLGDFTPQSTNEEVLQKFEQIKFLGLVNVLLGAVIILLAVVLRYGPYPS